MNIQIITKNEKLYDEKNIKISDYSKVEALDNFDINIIDLLYEKNICL